MTITKYIILDIICGIIYSLPISPNGTINILHNTFNTNVFKQPTYYYNIIKLGIVISILLIFKSEIKKNINLNKKTIKNNSKYLLYIILSTIIPLPLLTSNFYKSLFKKKLTLHLIAIFFLINSLLLIYNNKNNNKDRKVNLKDAIMIGISSIFNIIPGSCQLINLLTISKLRKLSKKQALNISISIYTTTIIINTILSLNFFKENILILTIGIFVTTLFSYYTLNYFIKLYNKNKLSKLSLYFIITSIFILIWFRDLLTN